MNIKEIIKYIVVVPIIIIVYRYFFLDEKNLSWKLVNFLRNDMCIQELDSFYSDDKYIYSFLNSCYASGKYIVFSNGKIYSIKNAIKKIKSMLMI